MMPRYDFTVEKPATAEIVREQPGICRKIATELLGLNLGNMLAKNGHIEFAALPDDFPGRVKFRARTEIFVLDEEDAALFAAAKNYAASFGSTHLAIAHMNQGYMPKESFYDRKKEVGENEQIEHTGI